MWFSVSAEMFQRLPESAESSCEHAPAGGYPGAFSDWNFISSIGAYVCPASSSPLRRHGRSASPCDFFLLFLLADGGDDVDHASDAAARKRAAGIHQGLVVGEPSMRFRELFEGRPARNDLCDDVVVELPQHRDHVFARKGAHGLKPPHTKPHRSGAATRRLYRLLTHELGTALDGRRWQLTRGRYGRSRYAISPAHRHSPIAGDGFF